MKYAQTKIIGDWGENKARRYLVKNNYYIWHNNWINKFGEIDIIAIKKRELVFIEVKTRKDNTSSFHEAIDAVDIKKKKKIIKLAESFLKKETKRLRFSRIKKIRYDIIGITYEKDRELKALIHLKNAF